MLLQEQTLTVDEFREFVRLPESATQRYELAEGMLITMAASSPLNTIIASRVGHYLNAFVLPRGLGHITAPDGGFKLGSGTVRQPDAAFISSDRFDEIPKEFDFAPDLAVEVVSPSEDVLKKVKEYLAAGTQLVWAIYPLDQAVEVFRPNEPRWQTYTIEDTLSGEAVLPDFSLAVRDIFPQKSDQVK